MKRSSLVKRVIALGLISAMTVAMSVNSFAAEVTEEVYKTTTAITTDGDKTTDDVVSVANPLKSLTEDPNAIVIEYTAKSEATLAAWQVMFQFIGTVEDDHGFVAFTYWPMIQYNAANNVDGKTNYWCAWKTNQDSDLLADDTTNYANNENHTVKYVITKTSATLTVDGTTHELVLDPGDTKTTSYEDLFGALMNASTFEVGGKFTSSDTALTAPQSISWWGELAATYDSIKISVVKEGTGTTTNTATQTGDAFTFLPVVALALAAIVVVAAKKKTVNE